MILTALIPLASHLWQSTLFAAVAGLLTLALRRNQARVRYWLWLAASYKLLLPFSLLVSIGHHFELRAAPVTLPPAFAAVTDAASGPIFLTALPAARPAPAHLLLLLVAIWAIWACGFAAVVLGWTREWLRIRTMVRAASPLPLGLPIRVVSAPARLEPGVFGIFRPIVLLPEGLPVRLTQAQLQAVLAHELCHVRRRDNLAAAVHMLVEALFWFYPLVWWLGARMVDERERACDEDVLRLGSEPQVYAESILKVCEFYLESPIVCVAGVSGSNLRKRMGRIMSNHVGETLNGWKKLFLATAGAVALTVPILVGALTSSLRAQAPAPTAATGQVKFDAISIKLNESGSPVMAIPLKRPGGHVTAANSTLRFLIAVAYDFPFFESFRTPSAGHPAETMLLGAPNWIDSKHFDIEAETGGNPSEAEKERMIQALLADRFKLMVHQETRQFPVFALVFAKGAKEGPKLKPHRDGAKCFDYFSGPPLSSLSDDASPPPCNNLMVVPGSSWRLAGENVTMQMLAKTLSYMQGLDRAVVDRTGLSGNFDVSLDWTLTQADPSESDSSARPSIFTAIQQQLGLKLEPEKGPVAVLVIDHVEEPSPN